MSLSAIAASQPATRTLFRRLLPSVKAGQRLRLIFCSELKAPRLPRELILTVTARIRIRPPTTRRRFKPTVVCHIQRQDQQSQKLLLLCLSEGIHGATDSAPPSATCHAAGGDASHSRLAQIFLVFPHRRRENRVVRSPETSCCRPLFIIGTRSTHATPPPQHRRCHRGSEVCPPPQQVVGCPPRAFCPESS